MIITKVITLFFIAISLIVLRQCREKIQIVPTENKEITMEKDQMNLVGGWKSIEVTDTVKELADYVIIAYNIKTPINIILNAESQVVSGKNYRFIMSLENGDNYMAQVYVTIKGTKEITNFKKID
tara:strand:+ start:5090 stop:5464 length:375 start_codon:yes stop_codon:yes gene_type:complete